MKISKTVLFVVILLIFITLPSLSFCQPPPDPGCLPDDPTCPIDSGVVALIAAALAIAFRKAYNVRLKKTAAVI